MSTLTPPVQLEHPENQFRVDYMQDVASQHNFEYTTVRYVPDNFTLIFLSIISLFKNEIFILGVLWTHRNTVER